MIYLFEDRPARIYQYTGKTSLPLGITLAKFDYEGTAEYLSEYIQLSFPEIEAILFHKSYRGEDNKIKYQTLLIDYCNREKIPFILFSGGIEATNYYYKNETLSGSVNSKILYQNLEDFSVSKDIRVLCMGPKFVLNEFINLIREIHTKFSSANEDDLLNEKEIETIVNLSNKYLSLSTILDEAIKDFLKGLFDAKEGIPFSELSHKLSAEFQKLALIVNESIIT